MPEEQENTLSIEHSITHLDKHLQLSKPHCVQAAGFHAQEGVHNRVSKSIHSWKEQWWSKRWLISYFFMAS